MRVILASLFLAFGIALFSAAVWSAWQGHSAFSWPQTNGQIIESGITKSVLWPGYYYAQLRYRYQVDEVYYEGERMSFQPFQWPSSAMSANQSSRRYPPGQWVSVFYHPEKAERSVLNSDLTNETKSALLTAFSLLCLALVFAWPYLASAPQAVTCLHSQSK